MTNARVDDIIAYEMGIVNSRIFFPRGSWIGIMGRYYSRFGRNIMSNNDLSTKSLSGFQKRLRLLMAEAHIKSNRALARAISEKGYFGETTEDSVVKAVQLHLRPAEKNVEGLPPSLSLKQALGYCSLFKCSMDYLLGRTPIKSQDYNVRLICEWLRIPEETVVKIEKMTNHKTFFCPNYGLWCDDAGWRAAGYCGF